MTARKKKTDKNPRKPAAQNIFYKVMYGNVVTSEFFARHWIKIFILVVMVMIFISTKYQCMTAMETIKSLENELDVMRTECIRERSDYMSRIRESAMQAMVDSVIPGLSVPGQPPYILDSEGKPVNVKPANPSASHDAEKQK